MHSGSILLLIIFIKWKWQTLLVGEMSLNVMVKLKDTSHGFFSYTTCWLVMSLVLCILCITIEMYSNKCYLWIIRSYTIGLCPTPLNNLHHTNFLSKRENNSIQCFIKYLSCSFWCALIFSSLTLNCSSASFKLSLSSSNVWAGSSVFLCLPIL